MIAVAIQDKMIRGRSRFCRRSSVRISDKHVPHVGRVALFTQLADSSEVVKNVAKLITDDELLDEGRRVLTEERKL